MGCLTRLSNPASKSGGLAVQYTTPCEGDFRGFPHYLQQNAELQAYINLDHYRLFPHPSDLLFTNHPGIRYCA
jgi:hypothetical protein